MFYEKIEENNILRDYADSLKDLLTFDNTTECTKNDLTESLQEILKLKQSTCSLLAGKLKQIVQQLENFN